MSRRKKRSLLSAVLILAIGFAGGWIANKYFYTDSIIYPALTMEQTKALNQAMRISDALAIEKQDSDKLVSFALKGIAAGLDDEYAYYFTPEELKQYEDASSGKVEGSLGMVITDDEGKIIITSVYKDFGAYNAGIRPCDELIAVDGVSVKDKPVQEISKLALGEVNTTAEVEVKRNGKTLNFIVTRISGQRQMTEYRMIDDILYIKIYSFHGNATEYFDKALAFGEENGYKSIIIDVRDNGGGEVEIFNEIADRLAGEGEIFYALTRSGEKLETCYSDANKVDKPMCVLINASTASAAEALAGVLHDMENASVVGVQSFGKGIMQSSYSLSGGGVFKLTVGEYYLPSGECIHKKGITPDFKVELPDELAEKYWLLNDENDLQLKKAIELLTK